MKKPWENETCENIYSYSSAHSVPVAAALWCGIPVNEIDHYIGISYPKSTPAILRHPHVKMP